MLQSVLGHKLCIGRQRLELHLDDVFVHMSDLDELLDVGIKFGVGDRKRCLDTEHPGRRVEERTFLVLPGVRRVIGGDRIELALDRVGKG